ncbi:MAG: VOC family protein [Candidatus Sulfotelmatobacter sp.]
MQKITPFLWFDSKAEEAANFYVSIFKNSKILSIARYECGWLRDKYGLSWQIIPTALSELMQDKDPVKSQRVFKAMLQMTKIDIEGLQRAYRGE